MALNNQTTVEHPFEFKGTAGQYFGIWIVNILLTIITIGFYSAWAKVRTNRYFYGNTVLAGSSFGYLATPMAILKGWAIAVIAFIIYSAVTQVFPSTGLLFMVVFLIVLPWIVVRSMAFRARNTSYRNIRFTFNATYGEAAKIFIGLTLLLPLTLGLIYPYYIFTMNRFLVNHSGYGTTKFQFNGKFADFYKVFIRLGLFIVLFLVLLVAVLFPTIKKFQQETQHSSQMQQSLNKEIEDMRLRMQEDMAHQQTIESDAQMSDQKNAVQDEGDIFTQSNIKPDEHGVEGQLAPGAINATSAYNLSEQDRQGIGETENYPQGNMSDMGGDMSQYPEDMEYAEGSGLPNDVYMPESGVDIEASENADIVASDEEIMDSASEDRDAVAAMMAAFIVMAPLLMLATFLFYLIPYAYIRARIQNLVFNNTELAGHRFHSSLRARDLTWLYFSNTLAIMLSFGLLIPWVKVRMARYRASKLVLLVAGDIDSFTQAEREQVSALGEEMGEVFDVDIGI